MEVIFGSFFLLIAVAPFLYHVALCGISAPLNLFNADGTMLRLRWIPLFLFTLWIAFNAMWFGIWTALPNETLILSHDSFVYGLYYPCLLLISIFG